jgi:hypothetical protein
MVKIYLVKGSEIDWNGLKQELLAFKNMMNLISANKLQVI